MTVQSAIKKAVADAIADAIADEREGSLYRIVVGAAERAAIEATLYYTGGNQCGAARILGINRNTLRAKRKALGVRP